MAVTYSNATKTGRLQVVNDLVCGKTLGTATGSATAGSLVIGDGTYAYTAGGSPGATGVLATLPLSTTPFTVGTTTLTITGNPSATASATGTASRAAILNNSGVAIIGGLTVGTSGQDIIIGTTSITSGLTVTCTGASSIITHG